MADEPVQKTGVTSIDDRPVSAIDFERHEQVGQEVYSLSFRTHAEHDPENWQDYLPGGTQQLVEPVKDLGKEELAGVVGPKNTEVILQTKVDRGTLEGSTLHNERGITPETPALSEEERVRTKEEAARTLDKINGIHNEQYQQSDQARTDRMDRLKEINGQLEGQEQRVGHLPQHEIARQSVVAYAAGKELSGEAAEKLRNAVAERLAQDPNREVEVNKPVIDTKNRGEERSR